MKRIKIAVIAAAIVIIFAVGIFIIINLPDKTPKEAESSKTDTAAETSEEYPYDSDLSLSENNLYTMDKITSDYLDKLNKKVDIYFLMKLDKIKNSSDADQLSDLTNLLEQYDKYENVNLIDIDYDENSEIIKELNPDHFNLQEGDIIVKCGDVIKRIPGSEMYKYEFATAYFQGENLITGAIKAAAENISPTVYFLSGHGEKSPGKYYKTLMKNLKTNNYVVKELDLNSVDSVPDNAAIIIVPAPKNDITDDEQEKLNKYLDNGGNLSLLMSPVNNDTIYTNITEIMNDYCLDMSYNRVYETDDSRYIHDNKYEIVVQLVDIESDPDLAENENLTDLTSALIDDANGLIPYMPESRSFYEYKGDNYSKLNICPLMEAYDTADSEAYGGKKEADENANDSLWLSAYSENPERNGSKLVVMGNAEFIDNVNISEGHTILPLYLYLSTITWMADSNVDLNIPSKKIY